VFVRRKLFAEPLREEISLSLPVLEPSLTFVCDCDVRDLVGVRDRSSNLSISACEYAAPTTSELPLPLELGRVGCVIEAFGLDLQKGDVSDPTCVISCDLFPAIFRSYIRNELVIVAAVFIKNGLSSGTAVAGPDPA